MRKKQVDIWILGFALFSMFFGAGNVIFPPYLGFQSGTAWLSGFLSYYIADIGLALLALFALLRHNGIEEVLAPIGQKAGNLLLHTIVLCIGPMVAIPRTAATTLELSIDPFLANVNPWLFSFLFFGVILLLAIQESALVNIVGKFLTPLLLVGLVVLIVVGIVSPVGEIVGAKTTASVPLQGIEAGYQTMDVLAALIFGSVALANTSKIGYTDAKERRAVVFGGGVVAGAGLLLVYMGLTYLGACAGARFPNDIGRSSLVTGLVYMLLGRTGSMIFGIVVALACMTTALALVSSASSHFSQASGGKVSYRTLVIVCCLLSAVLSNFGVDMIISIAGPILNMVYPPALVLCILAFCKRKVLGDLTYRFATGAALLVSILLECQSVFGINLPFLAYLPLQSMGFSWLCPSLVFAVLGYFLGRKRKPS